MLIEFIIIVILGYLMLYDLDMLPKKNNPSPKVIPQQCNNSPTPPIEAPQTSENKSTEDNSTEDILDDILKCHTHTPKPIPKLESTQNNQFMESFTNFRNHINQNGREEDPVDKINCFILEGNQNFAKRVGNIPISDIYDTMTKTFNLYK